MYLKKIYKYIYLKKIYILLKTIKKNEILHDIAVQVFIISSSCM